MKAVVTILVGAALAVTSQAQSGVVQWDIQRRQQPQLDLTKIRKRASTVEGIIANQDERGGYFANCKLGTPGQQLTLQLDTGSSDIWVPDRSSKVCQSKSGDGCALGSFSPSKSSTYETVGKGAFDISYVDGTSSTGDYFTDVFTIGGASLENMTMGLGLNTDIGYGLVGVGYATNEAVVGSTNSLSSAYPNLPVSMMDEGLIKTVAYSLWLNDLDASSGSILFGGIDTEKYKGDLTRIKIYPTSDVYTAFLVALTSLEASSPSGGDTLTSTKFPVPVVLDSGTTLSYLPDDLAKQVWHEVGALYTPEFQLAVLPCQMRKSNGHFSFGFAGPNGPRIDISMDELVLDLTNGQPPVFNSGPYKGMDACEFGIQNYSSPPYLLGDTFLRSAYVVYDLINNEVGIAETDFNSTKSNIVPFASASAHIPSATIAPDQSAVTEVPSVTSPAYAARPGFTDSAGVSGASGVMAKLGFAQAAIIVLSMLVATAGSELIAL